MDDRRRQPFEKSISPDDMLSDNEIKEFVDILTQLKANDFSISLSFDAITSELNSIELQKLKLCKLLYCVGYRKEMFLHLGIIVESRLNAIISLYSNSGWQVPLNFRDEPTQKIQFEQFLKIKALSEKADYIVSVNLLNNPDASNQIRHKVQALRFLRNYGGHSKSVNEFFDKVIDSQPDCDSEINDAFSLIRLINIAIQNLTTTPPPLLP